MMLGLWRQQDGGGGERAFAQRDEGVGGAGVQLHIRARRPRRLAEFGQPREGGVHHAGKARLVERSRREAAYDHLAGEELAPLDEAGDMVQVRVTVMVSIHLFRV